MKINKKVFIFAAILFISLWQVINLAQTPPAQAKSLWDMQGDFKKTMSTQFGQAEEPTDIRSTTVNIIKVFLGLLGLIFLILIIAGGFRWMTANGNENKVEEAKSQLKNGVIGIIIIMAAYVIVGFVFKRIGTSL